ncbi:hypothetical protein IKF04_03740 [Candidatus Saccharibacteria bacterium]|nr:hypothetical protein [Candidatus Saccharibacteria bacterium]
MDYFARVERGDYEDLTWNIPEQKQGIINIIGGNSQNFRAEIRTAEFMTANYPIKEVRLVLPSALKNSLPDLPNLVFLPSTDSGSFSESQELNDVFNSADFNLLLGDLSKNSATGTAVAGACRRSEKMTLLTRDTVDIVADNDPERTLMNENLIFFTSMAQLQKLLRAVYYPKMLLLTQSLVQVSEVLHKFTLSYPVKLVTLHDGQILLAENGTVRVVSIEESGYSPVTIWSGELAAKITVLNLFNPNNFLPAGTTAVFK